MFGELLPTLYRRDGDPQSRRSSSAPCEALQPVTLSQLCRGKKWLFCLLVRSYMALLSRPCYLNMFSKASRQLQSLGWKLKKGFISLCIWNSEKDRKQDAQGLQMLWLSFPLFLRHYSDPVRRDLLFLFHAGCLIYPHCCCVQMIYSYANPEQWLQHRLFALKYGHGQHWGVVEAAVGAGST